LAQKQKVFGGSVIMVNILKWFQKIIFKIKRGGLDKMAKDVYIYYSGPTDDTGKRIAEALKVEHGKKKPAALQKGKIIIGWGCKTKDKVNFGANDVVLNHPDNIRTNRNKLKTLEVLKKAGVPVADFITADKVLASLDAARGAMSLPLVGRKKFHQGGKDFWTCLTRGQVQRAIKSGAEYFQNYIAIETEYRLHVFQGEVINMQKKVERDDLETAYVEQHGNRIQNIAEKNNVKLDKTTAEYILKNLGKRQGHADQIIKSNTRGWKFSQIKTAKKELQEAAVNAVKAIGLDFGAVDCCLTEDGSPYIIEVNTGPGLQGTSFDAYIEVFKKAIAKINKPVEKKPAPAKTVDKTKTVATAAKPIPDLKGGSVKDTLAAKAALMSEMIANADEDEAAALQSVLKKMWG
jgi:glutathione synthase/RimK-type ligase-like ATP-grasp enzyme